MKMGSPANPLVVCRHLANNKRSIFMRTFPLVRGGRQTV